MYTIKELHLNEGLEYIGSDAFREALGEVDLIIPEGVEMIGSNCFWNTGDKIRHVELSSTLKTISSYSLCFGYLPFLDLKNVGAVYGGLNGICSNSYDQDKYQIYRNQFAVLQGLVIRNDNVKFNRYAFSYWDQYSSSNSHEGGSLYWEGYEYPLRDIVIFPEKPWEMRLYPKSPLWHSWEEAVLHIPAGASEAYLKAIREGSFPQVKEVKEMDEPELLLFVQEPNNVYVSSFDTHESSIFVGWANTWSHFDFEDDSYKLRYDIFPIGGAETVSVEWLTSDPSIAYFIDDATFKWTGKEGMCALGMRATDNFGNVYERAFPFAYSKHSLPFGYSDFAKALKGGFLKLEWTDVSEIDNEETTPAVYYNMQGLRIGTSADNLTPGLYIERRGKSSRKIVITE